MKQHSPVPWWEEYLGLRIRFQLLRPKRVWQTMGTYIVVWIIPSALLPMIPSWLGLNPTTPVQARTKEVHISSQLQDDTITLEDSEDLGANTGSSTVSVPLTGSMSMMGQGMAVAVAHNGQLEILPPPLPLLDEEKNSKSDT